MTVVEEDMTKYNRIFQNMSTYLRIYPKYKELSEKKGFFFFGNRYGKTRRLLHLIYILKVYCVQEMNIYYAHIERVNRQ